MNSTERKAFYEAKQKNLRVLFKAKYGPSMAPKMQNNPASYVLAFSLARKKLRRDATGQGKTHRAGFP